MLHLSPLFYVLLLSGHCNFVATVSDPWEQTSVKFQWKYNNFHSMKRIWKYRLQNDDYFVSVFMC